MRKGILALLTLALMLTAWTTVWAGDWQVREDLSITEEAQAAFDKAVKDSEQKAVALLGTQVVAGINYCFLCRTGMTPSYQLVYIYDYLQSTTSIGAMHRMGVGECHTCFTGSVYKPVPEIRNFR